MPVESAADRLSFLSLDEFGDLATYTAADGNPLAGIAGIFDDPHLSVTIGQSGVASSDLQPTFLCRAADLPPAAKGGDAGDTLVIVASDLHAQLSFRVIDLHPDGTGMMLITLGAA